MLSDTETKVLSRSNDYILTLSEAERAKVLAHMTFMKEGDFVNITTKKLDGPIRELIVKQHRLIYFKMNSVLYFVSAFKKQSAKTPKVELDYAKEVFKMV